MNMINELDILSKKYLIEAGLDYKHNKVGETNFSAAKDDDFHIEQIIQDFAVSKNITLPEARKVFESMKAESLANMEKSPKINATMMLNIAESTAFKMLEETEFNDIKFDKRLFLDIFEKVKYEVPEFYPLSNTFEPRRIDPKVAFSPDPLAPEYNSVGTAACTPSATLIFNVPFMEKLMKFASVKGIKANPNYAHGKKYESQGGDIPDEYLYCEFVLLHEIMHYANGDFFFEKAFNLNGNIVNYVGDFISNYNLVKSGYAQLPIGLFNDEINYDRYPSYQMMYNIVEDEMKKLSNEDQENMMDELDKLGDEMPQDGEGADPKDKQDGQPQDGQPQDGQPQDGQPQDGQPQDGQPQDGQGSGSGDEADDKKDEDSQDGQGSGSGDKSDDKKDEKGSGKSKEQEDKEAKEAEDRAKERQEAENNGETSGKAPSEPKANGKKKEIPKSIDDAIKSNQQTHADGQGDLGRDAKPGMNKDAAKPGDLADMMSGSNNGGPLSADGNPYELAERDYTPKLNWKQLLKKMIPSGTEKDETYTKPSRRTTSSMVSIAQTGAGVVKPGTKDNPSDKKGLCFVLDESGSTMNAIGEMKASILKLMEKNAKQLNGYMYMIKFSNDVHLFKVDVKKMKYGRVVNINDFINTGKADVKCTKNARELFKSTYGGGTNLDSKIANIVLKLKTKLNFNTVIFSDTDIAYGDNAATLKRIYKQLGTKAFALIGTDKDDYKAFAQLLGDKKNITHF